MTSPNDTSGNRALMAEFSATMLLSTTIEYDPDDGEFWAHVQGQNFRFQESALRAAVAACGEISDPVEQRAKLGEFCEASAYAATAISMLPDCHMDNYGDESHLVVQGEVFRLPNTKVTYQVLNMARKAATTTIREYLRQAIKNGRLNPVP